MIIDGRAIAEVLYERLKERTSALPRPPRLAIVTCAPNFETQKYLSLKQKKAAFIGIETHVVELPATCTTFDMLHALKEVAPSCDGIVVQLPLPKHVDTDAILHAVPVSHDIDALNPETTDVLSPVVGAIKAILEHHAVQVAGKRVVVIGNGRLVGLPATAWFKEAGATVEVVTKDTMDISLHTQAADIIVCGAGVPGLLTTDMIKDDVIILDAGTSESNGMLRGDADPLCAQKAALFTPVPGGIGPITVAVLLENVVSLAQNR